MNEARQKAANMDYAGLVQRFAAFGYHVLIAQIAFTMEQIEDFRQARPGSWTRPSRLTIDEPGLPVIKDAQPLPLQLTRIW